MVENIVFELGDSFCVFVIFVERLAFFLFLSPLIHPTDIEIGWVEDHRPINTSVPSTRVRDATSFECQVRIAPARLKKMIVEKQFYGN